MPDVEFVIEDHPTVVLLRPRTDAAKAWAEGALPPPAWPRFDGAVVVGLDRVPHVLDVNDG